MAVCLVHASARAADRDIDFQRDVQPILERHCTHCHGAQDQQSSLRLDWGRGAIEGGDAGPAVVGGDAAASLLYLAISGTGDVSRMPPEGEPELEVLEIDTIRDWIDSGALIPEHETAPPTKRRRSSHWSFQPIEQPIPPAVDGSPSPLDAFVLQRLDEHGLAASPMANRETLVRRVHLDLLGLPPSPELVARFLNDDRPDAYQRLVDRMLASPAYGERWGRAWLDLARYADSNGYTRDMPRSIWPYRDWVIDALNSDMPFDRFTIAQLAGDLLPEPTREEKIATGFHRNTLVNEEGGADPEQFRVEAVIDRVNTTGAVFLGLTVGCAQCHEHKYDPLTQREYFQLYAFFNQTQFSPQDQMEPRLEVPSAEQLAHGELQRRDAIDAQIQQLEQTLRNREAELSAAERTWAAGLTDDERKALPFEVKNAIDLPEADRTEQHRRDLTRHFRTTPSAQAIFPELRQIAELREQQPKFQTTLVMQEAPEPRDTHVLTRGDFLRPGKQVQPDVPEVLPPLPEISTPRTRMDLARWLVRDDQPLTPRVVANRDWAQFFGRGLVATENDFGTQGEPPTHPELLDWLAAELIRHRWDLKSLHRQIVTSATYRQGTHTTPEAMAVDPTNRLLGRQVRMRLDAERIRDSALTSSGLLSYVIGGPPVMPPQPEGVFEFTQDKKTWTPATGHNRFRRALYTHLWRSSLHPSLTVFDFPDPNVTCTRRNRSNTPLQALTLANDEAFLEFARGLAVRAARSGSADAERLRAAWTACLGRAATDAELAALARFLESQRTAFQQDPAAAAVLVGELATVGTSQSEVPGEPPVEELAAWVAIGRVLLNLDEFITRE